jgi:uncharacterized phage infection (PIP) family protein YhgE
MKKSTEIKNELDRTAKRLSELITMQDGINTGLQTLQDGFVNGKTPLDKVQAEQARLDTLNSSIKSLEDKQSELQTAFDNLSAVEARQALLERLAALGSENEPLLNDYLETRNEFHEIISEYAEKLVKKISSFRTAEKEFHSIFKQLSPIENLQWITLELRPLEYAQSINIAETILSSKLARKEQQIEKARFDAELERNSAAQKAKRQEEEAVFVRALDATRQRIIQYRIDNELPPLSPQTLDIEAAEIQSRSAKA